MPSPSVRPAASAAIVVTAPAAGPTNVKSCNEYSTDVLRDKWDMSQRTDLGWRIYNTVEQPPSNLTNISFAGGIFSAKTTSTDPNISILDSHYLGTMATGKVGAAYPIDANKYTVLMMRASFDPDVESTLGIIYWSTNTIYDGVSWSNPVHIFKGWAYYAFDIPAIGMWGFSGDSGAWTGTVGSLRIDPTQENNKTYQIDWIRLVEKDAALQQTIRWSGNSGKRGHLSGQQRESRRRDARHPGQEYRRDELRVPRRRPGRGDYYAVVVATGANPSGGVASPGYYRVNDTPILTFTKPTAEGSSEGFRHGDLQRPLGHGQPPGHRVHAEPDRGAVHDHELLRSGRDAFLEPDGLQGDEHADDRRRPGDPFVNFLYWDGRARGRNREINADRYHNLVTTFGIEGAWNVFVTARSPGSSGSGRRKWPRTSATTSSSAI